MCVDAGRPWLLYGRTMRLGRQRVERGMKLGVVRSVRAEGADPIHTDHVLDRGNRFVVTPTRPDPRRQLIVIPRYRHSESCRLNVGFDHETADVVGVSEGH